MWGEIPKFFLQNLCKCVPLWIYVGWKKSCSSEPSLNASPFINHKQSLHGPLPGGDAQWPITESLGPNSCLGSVWSLSEGKCSSQNLWYKQFFPKWLWLIFSKLVVHFTVAQGWHSETYISGCICLLILIKYYSQQTNVTKSANEHATMIVITLEVSISHTKSIIIEVYQILSGFSRSS